MSDLFLRIIRNKDGTFEICGTPQSLDALAHMLSMSAKMPDNYRGTLIGHGHDVKVTAVSPQGDVNAAFD